MLHEEEPSLMQQRDAAFVPQAFWLFVRMTTPRPPGTLRTNTYSAFERPSIIPKTLYIICF